MGDVDPINKDLSLLQFHDAKEGEEEARLPRSCPSHNANLLSRLGLEADPTEGTGEGGAISEKDSLEDNRPLDGPVRGSLGTNNAPLLKVYI